MGLCQNNGEFVLITAPDNVRLQEPAESTVGPCDPFATPTCQKALSAPAPSRDRSTNCCCGKGYLCGRLFSKNSLKVICSLPYRSNHIFNRLTLNPFQTEWQIYLAHAAASPAQVKPPSACNSYRQPQDRKGLRARADTQHRGALKCC